MQQITSEEYKQILGPDGPPGAHPMLHDPKEWWRLGDRVGVVIRDKVDNDWSFVTLAMNPEGGWQCYGVATSLSSMDEARSKMEDSFNEELKEGWWK